MQRAIVARSLQESHIVRRVQAPRLLRLPINMGYLLVNKFNPAIGFVFKFIQNMTVKNKNGLYRQAMS